MWLASRGLVTPTIGALRYSCERAYKHYTLNASIQIIFTVRIITILKSLTSLESKKSHLLTSGDYSVSKHAQ
jgi:hypothetical protein